MTPKTFALGTSILCVLASGVACSSSTGSTSPDASTSADASTSPDASTNDGSIESGTGDDGGAGSADSGSDVLDGGNASGDAGSNSLSGTVGGTTIDAMSFLAGYGTIERIVSSGAGGPTTTNVPGLQILIADRANSCSVTHNGNIKALYIAIDDDPVSVMSYPVVSPLSISSKHAFAYVSSYDATCNPTQLGQAASGTVNVTEVSSSTVSGTFDLPFGVSHLTGSFNTPICSSPIAALAPGDSGVGCVP